MEQLTRLISSDRLGDRGREGLRRCSGRVVCLPKYDVVYNMREGGRRQDQLTEAMELFDFDPLLSQALSPYIHIHQSHSTLCKLATHTIPPTTHVCMYVCMYVCTYPMYNTIMGSQVQCWTINLHLMR